MSDTNAEFLTYMCAALGPDAILPRHVEPGRWVRFSTNGRKADQAGWCMRFPDGRAGVFGCYRAARSWVWTAQRRERMTPAERAELRQQVQHAQAKREAEQRQRWAKNAQRIRALWARCVAPLQGDPVTRYLKRRRVLDGWPLPACIRLHPGLAYWHEGVPLGEFPTMVAPIVGPTGEVVALHCTYLTPEGGKADVPTVKKLTAAAGPLAGAAIPLGVPMAGQLGIAEGIETALAARCAAGVPVVAAYCADNLARWRWPQGLRRLLVFADADAAGMKAARELVARAVRGGVRAQALAPSVAGADWADVWAAHGGCQA